MLISSTTGHAYAQVLGYDKAAALALQTGSTLLVGGTKLLTLPLKPAPAAWTLTIPAAPALAGLELYTQAIHVAGVKPFALSNAQYLFLGY